MSTFRCLSVFCSFLCLLGIAVTSFAPARFAYADDYQPAGPFVLDNSTPITPPVSAHVNQTVQVVTTGMNFGTIGIHQDKAGGSRATITLSPGGSLSDSHSGASARIVAMNGSAGVRAATVDIQGAFPNAIVYDHYENIIDLTCTTGTCAAPTLEQGGAIAPYTSPKLLITSVIDDLDHLSTGGDRGTAISAGRWTTGTETDGEGRTNGTGELKFAIGATLSTDGTTAYYASGTYSGSFDMTLSY